MSSHSNSVWGICLCLTLCMTTVSSAQGQNPALQSRQTAAPAEVLDPVFDSYFDLALLAPAVQRGDADALADLAMQAALGEQVLLRSHKAATAKDIAQVAKDVALNSKNESALDRLLQFAKKTNDKQLAAEIETRRKLGGGSRSASQKLAVDDLSVKDLKSFQDYRSDIQLARRLGVLTKLERIRDDPNLRELPETLRDQIVASSEQAIRELDDTSSPLAKLLAASRACPSQRAGRTAAQPDPRQTQSAVKLVADKPRWNTVQQLVEIQINQETPNDDYLTWAPSPARIRIAPGKNAKRPVTVVLTNDRESAGGDVLFAPFQFQWPRYTTATQPTLTLTLPVDNSWVNFVVAGAFGRPSIRDKDTIVEAHLESAQGRVLGTHAMMVRVRKAAHRMTAEERARYLAVLERMRPQDGSADLFQYYEDLHRESGRRPQNESHRGPAFLPWHRAYLLQFERQLQAIDPSVSLPYWDWTADVSHLFASDFLGATTSEVVQFDGLNPIRNWTSNNQRIRRNPGVRGVYIGSTDQQAANLFRESNFGPYPQGFGAELENRMHDNGHGWIGGSRGWMADPGRAAQDPVFYLHHCNVDRIWAQWQYIRDRFGDTAPVDYWPPGNYSPGGAYEKQGNYLEDTMWPWNEGGSAALFPASGRLGVWPRQPTAPRPRDMIDYLGVRFPAVDLGFCYDDVAFGTAAEGASAGPPSPMVHRTADGKIFVAMQVETNDEFNQRAIRDFFNDQLPMAQRQQAGEAIQYVDREFFPQIAGLACGAQQPEALRIIAIKKAPPAAILDSLLHILEDAPANERTELAVAAAQAVRVATVSSPGHDQRQRITRVMRRFVNTPCGEVRDVALAVLIGNQDPAAVRFIKDGLAGKVQGFNVPTADAVTLLALDDPAQHLNVIRPLLGNPDPKVCVEAIRAVEFDPGSRPAIKQLLRDRRRPLEVRKAALQATERDMTSCLTTVGELIGDAQESPEIRVEALNSLAGIVSSRVRTINLDAEQVKRGARPQPLANDMPAFSDAGRIEIARLLDQVARQPGPDAVRAEAAKVLGWLKNNDPALRRGGGGVNR